MKRSEHYFAFALLPLDFFSIVAAFVLAYLVRIQSEVIFIWGLNQYLRFVFAITPFWILIFGLAGLYNIKNTRRGFDEFASIFLACSAGIMLVVSYVFLSRIDFFSRLVVIYTYLLSILLVTLGRTVVRLLQRHLLRWGIGVHRVLVIGPTKTVRAILNQINRSSRLGYKLIKVISAQSADQIEKIYRRQPFDDIIVADSQISDLQIGRLIEFAHSRSIGFRVVPNLYRAMSVNINYVMLGSIPTLEHRATPLDGWGKIIKRSFDIIGSIFGLIIFSPIFLFCALGIKIRSPGPIFFLQKRVGQHGLFTFVKFRTMRQDAYKEHKKLMRQHGPVFKLKEDPRVFDFGRFLRKTSLDELPQLWNVLKGEMSLVGPRPPIPEEVRQYSPWQRKRLRIKPGITGLWQVSGRADLDFDQWVRLDIYYIENWSLWLDLQILIKTFWVVIKGVGAY